MALLSGEQIQANLHAFAKRWATYSGTERAEAQTYLNELFEAYGQNRLDAGAQFEDPQPGGGIVDLIYPGQVIVEMKAPAEAPKLETHRKQALDYWHHSDNPATGSPAPPFVVLCAFQRFEVWDPGHYPSAPRDSFNLDELPARYEALLCLAAQDPLFLAGRRHLTTSAAKVVATLHKSLTDRAAAEPGTLRLFALQIVWCLFAESLGLLEGQPVERIITGLRNDHSRSSAAELGYLFEVLNSQDQSKRQGLFAGAPYANGGLFAVPTRVHLLPTELEILGQVAGFDWKEVDPTIFGALMEECLGRERRWELGAHYTHEVDILRIVRPSIVEPWQTEIDATTTPDEATDVLRRLCEVKVLDPACGCGNFLYVAYRELRGLEQRAKARIAELAAAAGVAVPKTLPSYPIGNLHGIELDEFATLITRVTLWMGHKLVTDRYGLVEPVLPLVQLAGVQKGDALKIEWPAVDVIIGNPPFNGSQHLRQALGDDYVTWLDKTFKCGVQDLCVYWFRRAADHLGAGGRAGLVGTNSISQNKGRGASLDYVAAHGGVITAAVSTEKWPGDANVHVSIVNWVKDPETPPITFTLDEVPVAGITTSLLPQTGLPKAAPLRANAGRSFQGPIPVGEGFVLSETEAKALLNDGGAPYTRVVRPYLIGDDITTDVEQRPRRWIIDFGTRPLEEAQRFPAALDIVEKRVRPDRLLNNDRGFREKWWLFGRPRGEMRSAIAGLPRYLASTATSKRFFLTWCEPSWCPSNLTNVFAFDDDFTFGLLTSIAHTAWAWHQSSTLKGTLRYTPTTVFSTFPWPYPVDEKLRQEVTNAGQDVYALRSELCVKHHVGLTTLYNTVEAGGHQPLADAHHRLDRTVLVAYGWPASLAHDKDELVRKLALRNAEIVAGAEYEPFPPLVKAAAPEAVQGSLYDL